MSKTENQIDDTLSKYEVIVLSTNGGDFIGITKPTQSWQKPTPFIHIILSEISKTVIRKGKNFKVYGLNPIYDVIFKDQRPILFDKILNKITSNEFEWLSDDKIKLTNFVISGKIDTFKLGFSYTPQIRNNKGEIMPLQALKYNYKTKQLEKVDEIPMIEKIRNKIRKKLKKN